MISIEVDESVLNEVMKEEIKKRLDKLDQQQTFWNTDDLKKNTRMSWGTILNTFFHEEGFPKAKVGGKWYFPAEQVQVFLLSWLQNQVE